MQIINRTPNLISTDSFNLEYMIILSSKFYFFIIYKEKQYAQVNKKDKFIHSNIYCEFLLCASTKVAVIDIILFDSH